MVILQGFCGVFITIVYKERPILGGFGQKKKGKQRKKGMVWWRSRRRQTKIPPPLLVCSGLKWRPFRSVGCTAIFVIEVCFWHWLLTWFYFFVLFPSFSTKCVLKCDTSIRISGGSRGSKRFQLKLFATRLPRKCPRKDPSWPRSPKKGAFPDSSLTETLKP